MSYDLRNFFHSLGVFGTTRALTEAPTVRLETDVPVEMLDADPSEVGGSPLNVSGYVDGIQNALCVTYRGHRPVYLAYVAAGVVDQDHKLTEVRERLDVIMSRSDRDWYLETGALIPSIEIDADTPDEIATQAMSLLGSERETFERRIVEDRTSTDQQIDSGHLVVDGNLVGRPVRQQVVGVVKTTRRRYLPDEKVLWGLPAGWRSPRFRIPAGSQGVPVPRYSCYLRLHSAERQAWNFGLVRLETFDADLLDPLGMVVMAERQAPGSRDQRYDRHIAPIRAVEETLRARRPTVFST